MKYHIRRNDLKENSGTRLVQQAAISRGQHDRLKNWAVHLIRALPRDIETHPNATISKLFREHRKI